MRAELRCRAGRRRCRDRAARFDRPSTELRTGSGQAYPHKPIRLVIPYPPGGGSDTIGRPLAQKISEGLGQQVVVENRGGANGNIGMEAVARAAPDGYTLVFALSAQLAINPGLYQ
ncbi:MAG: Bug family tripartite tricarboxylate transporter substrate binding protein, partial [Burkholderiales bacterium]